MKFCKNLQKVADISEPEWAPYWPNYKMLKVRIARSEKDAVILMMLTTRVTHRHNSLSKIMMCTSSDNDVGFAFQFTASTKKLIKALPSLVPVDEAGRACVQVRARPHADSAEDSSSAAAGEHEQRSRGQQHGDATGETAQRPQEGQHSQEQPSSTSAAGVNNDSGSIGKSPGEIAFFKLLHSEFRKAEHFFEKAMEEFTIREERVREGMNIMKQPTSIMLNAKWSLMAKGIYRLYKDLLLLETFAIMAYCSFSKILKKHDKVTGYETRIAFMTNVVNKANFTQYPHVLEMISRCEALYEDVTGNLIRAGQEGLYEDERLFISMIHRLNEQVLGSDDGDLNSERKEAAPRLTVAITEGDEQNEHESESTSRLRSLLQENEKKPFAKKSKVRDTAQVSDHHHADDEDDSDDDYHDDEDVGRVQITASAKRPGDEATLSSPTTKRLRPA